MSGVDVLADPSSSLTQAGEFLIGQGFYGLVWLDEGLTVVERQGHLVEFVTPGQPVCSTILALFGLEPELQAVRLGTLPHFELLNISVADALGTSPRLNFFLYWMAASSRFLLIVVRTTTQTELEAQLANQSRARMLAEAKLVEQAKVIARANTELARANRELSEFASVISHDLKSPMRALRYQAEDIEAALLAGDDTAARAHLRHLKQHTRRVSAMLTDLLAYARCGREEEAVVDADTRALVDAIVASLPRPPQFRVEVAGTWPRMETVAAALDLVLRNLIDNAIKHHDRSDGRVVIEATPVRAGLDISVRDDGRGIPREHHGAVFQPFLQLQADGATELASAGQDEIRAAGSGIGLAIVRKMVEAAAASLSIASDPTVARGTTFRVFWPGRIVA